MDVFHKINVGRYIMKNFILILFLLLPNSLMGETLIYYTDFEPFSFNDNGTMRGIYVDITKLAFKRMKTPYVGEGYPFKRALIMASKGQGIVVGILKTKEREKKLTFSEPMFPDKIILFVKKGKAFPYKSIEDLAGKTIGTKLGWSYGKAFDKAKVDKVFEIMIGDADTNFKRLINNRTDAYVDTLGGWVDAKKLGVLDKIEQLPTPVSISNVYIAVKKNTKLDLLKRFNKTVQEMKKDGSYDEILKKYNIK